MALKTLFSRMGKVRTALLATLMSLLVACTTLVFAFPMTRHAKADEIFQCPTAITLEKDAVAFDGFLENRTGYAFSTTENAAAFTLADKMSGEFYVEFIPVSSQRGIDDFSKFSFVFTEENSRLAFTVAFSPLPNGVLMSLSLSNTNQVKKEIITEGSFSNLSDQPIKFKFDPVDMIISDASGVVLANLKDAESLNSFKTGATFDSFVEYSVDMSFSGIASGKTAKVVLFDIAGQSLSGETLTDTSAPLVVGEPKLNNAIKGASYLIDTAVKTYDVIDGYSKQFKGDIKVFDSLNEEVETENGAFVPTVAQTYYVSYIPKDDAGNVGESYVYPIVVFENRPEIEFAYEFDAFKHLVNDDIVIGNGASIQFPGVTAKSDLMVTDMLVSATLKLGDVSVYQLTDATKGFDYEFTKVGTYTLTYSATDASGAVRNDVYTIVVNNDLIFDEFEFDREYRKNANIDLTAIAVRGEEVKTSIYAVYPDGRTYQNVTGLALDVEGMYTITASATLGNGTIISQTKYFNVKTDNAYLWEETDGVTVTSNVKSPSYSDEEYNGTMLTVDRPTEINYTNVINLKDNTASDILLETFVAPTNAGEREIETIEFIFTDIYDESNYIIVCLQWGPWQYYPEKVSVIAKRTRDWMNQGDGDNRKDSYNQPHQLHYTNMLWSTLSGKISTADAQYPSQKISFYFDYDSGLLYATPAATASNTFKAQVGDFKDERYDPIGIGNAFQGFTTGEVRLSVRFTNLYGVANVMVLNIDGQSMAGQYATDDTAPSVFVDYQGNSEDNLPVAKVGEYFKLFNAYGQDVANGKITNVTSNVYKLLEDGSWEEIAKETDKFIPDTVGQYKISYTTKDVAGNVGTKDVYINAVESISEIEYEFSSKNPTNLVVGNEYSIYSGKATGGSGALFENMKLMFEGEEIKLDEYGSFIPQKDGEYKLVVIVKDYIGETEPWEYVMTAEYDDAPILNPVTIPKALRVGGTFTFPTFTAVDYNDEGKQTVTLDAYVNGSKVEKSYTATQEDADAGYITFTLKYGEAEVTTYTIKVIDDKYGDETVFVYKYFDDNAASKSINTNGVTFNFTEDGTINIVEKIDIHFLSVAFQFLETDNVSSFDFIMTDSVDPATQVTFRLTPNSSTKSYATLNGKTFEMNGSFLSTGVCIDSTIAYNYKNNNITCMNNVIDKIKLTDDGKEFKGFASGSVYVTIKLNGVTSDSSIMIKQITGKYMISTVAQGGGPSIEVLGENQRIELNDMITIFPAAAYEFLEGVKSVTVKVTAPGGQVLINNEPADMAYQVKAEKFGTYTILYTANPNVGKVRTKRVSVSVANRQAPQITVNGEIPEGIKLGSTLELPSATVVASTEEYSLSILYLRPDDAYMLVRDNKITFTEKGTWLISYFAQDDDGLCSIKIFKVTVV